MSGTIFNKAYWITLTQPAQLREIYSHALSTAGFKIVNFTDHQFEPEGYTAVWLLAESHLALHTFPEENRTYIELTSCNEEKLVRFLELEEARQNKPGREQAYNSSAAVDVPPTLNPPVKL